MSRVGSINGCVFIIHDYQPSADGTSNGWQIYAPVTESGNIEITLSSVYARAYGMEYDYQPEDTGARTCAQNAVNAVNDAARDNASDVTRQA